MSDLNRRMPLVAKDMQVEVQETRYPTLVLGNIPGPYDMYADDRREVVLGKQHVIVRYSRKDWDKGSAWTHVNRNTPSEVAVMGSRVVGLPHTTNPWIKHHTDFHWCWVARRKPQEPGDARMSVSTDKKYVCGECLGLHNDRSDCPYYQPQQVAADNVSPLGGAALATTPVTPVSLELVDTLPKPGESSMPREAVREQGILTSEALELWDLAMKLEEVSGCADPQEEHQAAMNIASFIRDYKLEGFRKRPRVVQDDMYSLYGAQRLLNQLVERLPPDPGRCHVLIPALQEGRKGQLALQLAIKGYFLAVMLEDKDLDSPFLVDEIVERVQSECTR